MFALLTLPRGPAPSEPEPSGAAEPVGIVIRPGPDPLRVTLTRLVTARPAA